MADLLDDWKEEEAPKKEASKEKNFKLKKKLFFAQLKKRWYWTFAVVVCFASMERLICGSDASDTVLDFDPIFWGLLYPIISFTLLLVLEAQQSNKKSEGVDFLALLLLLFVPFWALLIMMGPDVARVELIYSLSQLLGLSYARAACIPFFLMMELYANIKFWRGLEKQLQHRI